MMILARVRQCYRDLILGLMLIKSEPLQKTHREFLVQESVHVA
jgi:hypothetical protein